MLTVIFSSLNGEKTLGIMLTAFCEIQTPQCGWKLIGVDNGSTDATAEIMQSFKNKLPLTVLSMPVRGKNNSLNEALKHLEGSLAVFTDDDVIPDPGWLCELWRQAEQHPEYALFGGAILPHWPRTPEDWILNSVPLGMVFALSPSNLETGPISNGFVWGPNMAIRTHIFEQGFKFNASIGPDGSNTYAMGSELELTSRLSKENIKSWFCKDAIVHHIIRENQMEKPWVLQRFFRSGRSFHLTDKIENPKTARFLGVERWLYKKLILSYFKSHILRMAGKENDAFTMQQSYYRTKGIIYQSRLINNKKLK